MEISAFNDELTQGFYCDFLKVKIDIVIDLGENDELKDFESILKTVLSWGEDFYKKLEPMLFAYYDETLAMRDEEYPAIQTRADVWRFANIGAITLHSHEGQHYAMASGSCDWEEEHGLEFDVDSSNLILYLGAFIGNGFYEDPKDPNTYNFVRGE